MSWSPKHASRWPRWRGWPIGKANDPLIDPHILSGAVARGILDAPHLAGSRFAPGRIVTHIDQRGACVAVNPASGQPIDEAERVAGLL